MTPLRVAIVGAGIGVAYAEAFMHVPGVEVVALCASSRRNAEPAARRLGIAEVHTDLAAVLAAAPDVVVVATPNDLHCEMTLAALEAGAHVMCDKPLGLDAAEAHHLWAATERAERRHAMPFWWRLLPEVARAQELLADGGLGEPTFATVRYLNCGFGDPHGRMRWQFDRRRAGHGALANIGSHAIAALQWLAGDLAALCARTEVSVRERRWPDGRPGHPDAEDTVAFVGELGNGAPVSFLASSIAYDVRSSFELALHLQYGSLTIAGRSAASGATDVGLSVMRRGDAAPRPEPTGGHRRALVAIPDGLPAPRAAFVTLAAELVDAIRRGRPAAPGFDEGARVQEVIDAAAASAAGGGWLAIERAPAPVGVRPG